MTESESPNSVAVLFVCVENSNRSQMAEAFARHLGGPLVHSFSAGSQPSGQVNPKAVAAMAELGIDLESHHSKSLDDLPALEFDCVVTMGCGDACPWVPARRREDWPLTDPKSLRPARFNEVRDEIADRVRGLLDSLGALAVGGGEDARERTAH